MKISIVGRYTCLLLPALFVSLTGCCGVPVVPTLPPTDALASLTVTPLPTVTPSPTPTSELPTNTPMPSPIPPTRIPRPTPVPTMTADEEYAFVSEMLRDNGGCQLPCWWGFTPGETPWETTEIFFASLGKKVEAWSGDDAQHYTVYFDIPDHHHFHYQDYHEKDGTLDRIGIHAVPPADEDGHPVYGDSQFAEDWKAYMLPQILEVYGPPSQILLGLGGAGWIPFDLVLFYPEKGFLVQYSGSAERSEGDTFLVCPHRAEVTLYLWVPEQYTALEDVPGIGSYTYAADEMSGLHSLEDATGMSIEQFYQTFAQPDDQTCLETPVDIW
jgi:hypothetical protein